MKRRLHIRRTLFLIALLSLALWRLPPMINTFSQRITSGDGAVSSFLLAMSAATGASAKSAPGNRANSLIVIPAKGRILTPDQRSQLIGEAQNLAPISYDHESAPAANTPESVDPSSPAPQAPQTIE